MTLGVPNDTLSNLNISWWKCWFHLWLCSNPGHCLSLPHVFSCVIMFKMFLSFQMYSRFQTQWSRFRMDHLKSRSGFVWKCWVPQNAVVSHPFPTENLGQQQTAGCNSWAGPFSQKKQVAYCNCVPDFPTCNSVLSLSVFSVYLFNSVSLFFHLGFPLFSWTSPTFLGCLSYLDFPQLALSKHWESIPMFGHST